MTSKAAGCSVALLLLFACGPPRSQVIRVGQPGGPAVHSGWYRHNLDFLSGADPRGARARPWADDAERHENVMRTLVRERYDVKSALEFRYKYTALDSARNLFVLRWFARSGAPEEKRGIAGWEVLLLYTRRGRLAEAWVNEVPLE
jgi:hypothetical protein